MADITAKITIKKGLTAKVTVDRAYHAAGTTNHADLSNLEYANSGHTGFAPALGGDDNYMTDAEKTKLTGIATGATANSADATLLNRENHTGTQAESTITAKAEYATVALSAFGADLESSASAESFRPRFAGTIADVSCDVVTAPVGSSIIVDILKNGVSMLSTQITIDAGGNDSKDAAVQPVIGNGAFVSGDVISFSIVQVGSGTPGTDLKTYLNITR